VVGSTRHPDDGEVATWQPRRWIALGPAAGMVTWTPSQSAG
jgi:hypothetical protein